MTFSQEKFTLSGTISGVTGTWTYSPATGALTKIANFRLANANWSMDGSRIVGQRQTGDLGANTSEIVILTRS